MEAVRFALAYHRGLAEFSATAGVDVASRVGIHLGEVVLRDNPPQDVAQGARPVEVEGLAKPMTARLMSLAEGGQTLPEPLGRRPESALRSRSSRSSRSSRRRASDHAPQR